jgi:hypothetical protein
MAPPLTAMSSGAAGGRSGGRGGGARGGRGPSTSQHPAVAPQSPAQTANTLRGRPIIQMPAPVVARFLAAQEASSEIRFSFLATAASCGMAYTELPTRLLCESMETAIILELRSMLHRMSGASYAVIQDFINNAFLTTVPGHGMQPRVLRRRLGQTGPQGACIYTLVAVLPQPVRAALVASLSVKEATLPLRVGDCGNDSPPILAMLMEGESSFQLVRTEVSGSGAFTNPQLLVDTLSHPASATALGGMEVCWAGYCLESAFSDKCTIPERFVARPALQRLADLGFKQAVAAISLAGEAPPDLPSASIDLPSSAEINLPRGLVAHGSLLMLVKGGQHLLHRGASSPGGLVVQVCARADGSTSTSSTGTLPVRTTLQVLFHRVSNAVLPDTAAQLVGDVVSFSAPPSAPSLEPAGSPPPGSWAAMAQARPSPRPTPAHVGRSAPGVRSAVPSISGALPATVVAPVAAPTLPPGQASDSGAGASASCSRPAPRTDMAPTPTAQQRILSRPHSGHGSATPFLAPAGAPAPRVADTPAATRSTPDNPHPTLSGGPAVAPTPVLVPVPSQAATVTTPPSAARGGYFSWFRRRSDSGVRQGVLTAPVPPVVNTDLKRVRRVASSRSLPSALLSDTQLTALNGAVLVTSGLPAAPGLFKPPRPSKVGASRRASTSGGARQPSAAMEEDVLAPGVQPHPAQPGDSTAPPASTA